MTIYRSLKISLSRIASVFLVLLLSSSTAACPFCSALSNTLTEDLADSDVAGIAICVSPANLKNADALPIHRFRILQVIKGDPKLIGRTFDVASFKQFEREDVSFLLGVGEGTDVDWAPSPPLSKLGQVYLGKLTDVPADGPKRLEFFLEQLTSTDKMVADDAYNEFARALLKDLINLKPRLDREQIVRQILNAETPRDYRRLYWTLLGICGTSSDTRIVEEAIAKRDSADQDTLGLDAAFSCYLSLGGEMALRQVEMNYLGNPTSHYADSYAAILAIRVHSEEIQQIPRERLQAAFRLVLERKELADLVIPDLARWEDWSVVDRVEELFQQAEQATQYVKVPIVNYLRVCPKPEAKLALQRCQQLDPGIVRRAEAVFPLAKLNSTKEGAEKNEDEK